MRIEIRFETETVPDYVRGETKAEDRILEINFYGERLESYSEYMDDYDKKEAPVDEYNVIGNIHESVDK